MNSHRTKKKSLQDSVFYIDSRFFLVQGSFGNVFFEQHDFFLPPPSPKAFLERLKTEKNLKLSEKHVHRSRRITLQKHQLLFSKVKGQNSTKKTFLGLLTIGFEPIPREGTDFESVVFTNFTK